MGPAQTAVAKAVADSVAEGVIPKDRQRAVVIVSFTSIPRLRITMPSIAITTGHQAGGGRPWPGSRISIKSSMEGALHPSHHGVQSHPSLGSALSAGGLRPGGCAEVRRVLLCPAG